MCDEIFYTESNGGQIVLHDKYQYHHIRKYKCGSSFMRCSKYRKTNCRGSITIKDDQEVKRKEHFCNSDESTNIILKEKAALKEIAKKSDDLLPKIYKETLVRNMQDKGLDFVADIPSFSSMKHGLYDARNKAIGAKKTVFKRVEDVEIPTQFHDFLLGDYSNGKTRIIVFCTEQSKKILTEVREGFADSTFKSCPKPFVQLLSIHGDCGSTSEVVNVKPLVFAIMSDKKQSR